MGQVKGQGPRNPGDREKLQEAGGGCRSAWRPAALRGRASCAQTPALVGTQTWGAGQVADSGSCAAAQGHPGRGKLGLEQEEEGSAGSLFTCCLFGEQGGMSSPQAADPMEGTGRTPH